MSSHSGVSPKIVLCIRHRRACPGDPASLGTAVPDLSEWPDQVRPWQAESVLRGLLLAAGRLVDDSHDVGLLHDEELLTVDLHLGAGPFAEQHAVADLDVDGDQLAGLVAATRSNGDDFTFRGLLLRGVRDDDTAG